MVSQKGDDEWDFFEPWSASRTEASQLEGEAAEVHARANPKIGVGPRLDVGELGLLEGQRVAAEDAPIEDPDARTNSDTLATND